MSEGNWKLSGEAPSADLREEIWNRAMSFAF